MLSRLSQRLRAVIRRGRAEAELEEELRYHLDREVERLVASGMTREEASDAAAREFGNVESLKEESRDAWGTRAWEELVADVRYAVRGVQRNRGFAFVSVLTLAVGIGGSTAIFHLVDTVLLRTLPVEAPGELSFVEVKARNGDDFGAPPYPALEEIREGSRSLAGLAAYASDQLALAIDGRREQVNGQVVSGNYFDLLGVRPALGRTLTEADEALDPPVAVIGYDYWQRRFGGRPDVLGRTIRYEEWTLTIVGVTAPDFAGLAVGHPVDVTMPISVEGKLLHETEAWWLGAVARRKPGVSEARAAAEADRLLQGFLATSGTSAEDRARFGWRLELHPAARGEGGLRAQYSRPLLLLMALVGAVLLIACSNIASLLLARGAARRREFAVRTAIGASRLRLVRQLLVESLLLSVLGTAGGLLLGLWGARAIARFFAVGRYPVLLDVGFDGRVVLFATGLCLLTSVLFGLAPAVRAARTDPNHDLRGGAAPSARAGLRGSPGRLLVILQVILSVVLLLCAGLFVRSLADLRAVDLGFRPRGMLTLSVEPPSVAYPDDRLARLWPSLLERVQATPGVRYASLSVLTPFAGRDRARRMDVPGFRPVSERDLTMHMNYVSPGYFETMGTPLYRGRRFEVDDVATAPGVAILNRTAARFYFGDRDPIGRRVGFTSNGQEEEYEIVGVVEDAKHNTLREPAPRFLYIPVAQSTSREGRLTLAVRTEGDPAALLPALTRVIGALDPAILLTDVATAEQQIGQSILRDRLIAILSSAFGMLGLGLAALGLFGVVSQGVARRTREIGVRMALGAGAGRVRWEVMREGLWLASLGAALGLGVGWFALRAVSGLLYGVRPTDPVVTLGCVAILVSVAALASFLPARRASRTDPMSALRSD